MKREGGRLEQRKRDYRKEQRKHDVKREEKPRQYNSKI